MLYLVTISRVVQFTLCPRAIFSVHSSTSEAGSTVGHRLLGLGSALGQVRKKHVS